MQVDFIVRGKYVLPMDEDLSIIADGGVAVKDKKILEVGPYPVISNKYQTDKTIGGQDSAVLPGLINTHTHAPMALMRGMADELPLKQWLEEHIWPAESKWLGPEFVRDGVELACLEMLRAGVTAYNDMYFFEEVSAEAARRLGMRAVLGSGVIDFKTKTTKSADDCIANAVEFIEQYLDDEMISPAIAPHAPYTCGPDTLRKVAAVAEKYNITIHTHLSETQWEVDEIKKKYGKTPGMLLDETGLLGPNLVAAHCVWLTDEEIELFAKRGAHVSHCIESNLKLCAGIAPVPKMLKAGIKVSFGTDSAASNNDLNILGEISTATKVHKAVSCQPDAMDARTALLMATRWAAEAIGLGDVTGSLSPGKAADIVVIDLRKPHLSPMYNIYSHLAYSVMASDVDTVVVNGKEVVSKGKLLTADEQEIMDKANKWGEKIIGG